MRFIPTNPRMYVRDFYKWHEPSRKEPSAMWTRSFKLSAVTDKMLPALLLMQVSAQSPAPPPAPVNCTAQLAQISKEHGVDSLAKALNVGAPLCVHLRYVAIYLYPDKPCVPFASSMYSAQPLRWCL